MNVIHPDFFTVMKRFPDRKESIKNLSRKSQSFQLMCEDYRKCKDALTFWTQSDSKNAAIFSEYTALLHELESEIIQNLDENIKVAL